MKEISALYFMEILDKEKDIVIYGAGILGQGLFCLLKKLDLEKKVIGFAVSANTDHLNEYMGREIKCIDEYDENVTVLVAVKEQYVSAVQGNLGSRSAFYIGVHTLKDLFDNNQSLVEKEYKSKMKEILMTDEQYVTFCIRQIRRVRLDFEINIVDHCNLNCQCCNHFSPIANPYFLNIKEFEKDMSRIAELTSGDVGRIWLIGGEPLLHPNIKEFLYLARKYFPSTHITLDTNGTLLLKQSDDFWQALRDTEIELTLTKYPIQIDYEKINEKMKREKVKYAYTLSSAVLKTTYHLPLNVEGKLDGIENYLKCWHANECVTLRHGRIYTCPIAAHAHYFNEFFERNLYVGDLNSISIYEADNIEQIFDFLKRPIPFCRHCNIDGYTYDLPWGISKKDIKEWT